MKVHKELLMSAPEQKYKTVRGENGYAVLPYTSDEGPDRETALRTAVVLQGGFLGRLQAQESAASAVWQETRRKKARARMALRNLQRQLQRELSKQGKQQPKEAK